jgi:hypothetical protein
MTAAPLTLIDGDTLIDLLIQHLSGSYAWMPADPERAEDIRRCFSTFLSGYHLCHQIAPHGGRMVVGPGGAVLIPPAGGTGRRGG